MVANTATNWGPLEWVPGDIFIRHFDGKIVDDTGAFVPLSEVYVHHWVIFQFDKTRSFEYPNGGLCANLPSTFGIGAELFHVQYDYVAPYGIISNGSTAWTANMHLIRTSNVPQAGVQDCIECRCPDSNPPNNPHGGIQCCPNGRLCYGMENTKFHDAKNYYLQYTIGWVSVTEPGIIPLTVFSLDVTALNSWDCMLEMQIPEQPDGQVYERRGVAIVPGNWTIHVLEGHLHIGGIDITLEHWRGGVFIKEICNSSAIYGSNGSTPGNESGYLVGMDDCLDYRNASYDVVKGDELHTIARYDGRTLAGGQKSHGGVMGIFFVAAVAIVTPDEECDASLHLYCGSPPYRSYDSCMSCVTNKQIEQILAARGCTVQHVQDQCNQTTGGGHIPVPQQCPGLTLDISSPGKNIQNFNLTGPPNVWFAFGLATNSSIMDGTLVLVYSLVAGLPVMQLRKLGNHDPGTVVNPKVDCIITNLADGRVQITGKIPSFSSTSTLANKIVNGSAAFQPLWDLENSIVPSSIASILPQRLHDGMTQHCWLFALGSTPDLTYHGANRGTSCSYTPK